MFQSFKLPYLKRYNPGDTPDNRENVAFFRSLPNGSAILDGWALNDSVPALFGAPSISLQIGIHHMKAWVVFDGKRLTAWIGGVDINTNRSSLFDPEYWHDVQAEVEGPAARAIFSAEVEME